MKHWLHSRQLQFALLIIVSIGLLASSGNPPNGRTGAPFDGHCDDCHGINPNYGGNVTLTGLPATVQAGQVYNLTLSLNVTNGSPVRGGFQLVVVNPSNGNCGTLTAPGGSGTGTDTGGGGRVYIEHRNPRNFSGGVASWDFTWAAPASVPGNEVRFYYIGNFCNGSGSANDLPVNASIFLPFEGGIPVSASIVSSNNVACFGTATGSATVEATGGTTPYTYLWSNGQNGATANNLAAGTYTVTVTGASASGTATATVTITQPASALTTTTSVSGQITCAQNSATITANPAGGTAPYSFSWPNGSTEQSTEVGAAGSFTVTVTDANGCTKTAVAQVTQNITAPIAQAGNNANLTCLTTSVTLNGAGSSTGANISYLWTTTNGNIVSGATTLTPVVNQPGIYILTVSNTTNGCSSEDQTTVTTTSSPPTFNLTTAPVLTCANPTGQVCASSSQSNLTYSWSGPPFNPNGNCITVNAAGTYTCVATDPTNGCTAVKEFTVTSNVTPPVVNVSASPLELTCAVTSSTLCATPGTGYSYAWPNGATTACITVSTPGVYVVTVTNSQGCTTISSATVSQNTTTPTVSTTGTELTCTTPTGNLCATSGAPGATFTWTGPGGFASGNACATVNTAGTYTVTALGANGCTATATAVAIANNTPPTVTASSFTITCDITSGQLCATSVPVASSYAWAGPTGIVSTTSCLTTNVPGTYTVSVTTSNGCSASTTTIVSQNTTPPVVSIAPPNTLNCNNVSVTLNATASSQGPEFVYSWSSPNGGNIITGSNTLTPLVNSPGTYIPTITNSINGCSSTGSVTVTQSSTLNMALSAVNVSCFGQATGSAAATVTGGVPPYNYLWSTGATTASVSNLPAGTYGLVVTDTENCTVAQNAVSISQPAALAVTVTATGETGVGANNGTATASVSGGTSPYTYLWSNNATTSSISGLAPGTYTVTVADGNGCTQQQTTNINAFGCNMTGTLIAQQITCNGLQNGSLTAQVQNVNPPVTFLWNTSATTSAIAGLSAGTYTVTVTDAANCTLALSGMITAPTALLPNASATPVSGVSSNDGTATANPTGGTAPYNYLWSTNATTQTITGLAPGAYTVTVTDANSCSAIQSVNINGFNCNLSVILNAEQPTCQGQFSGAVGAITGGGTAPYNYLWSNGGTTSQITNVPADTYTVTITDATGCVTQAQAILLPAPPVTATIIEINQPACPGETTGSATIEMSGGGVPPFTYSWPSGGSGVAAGTYTVTVTNPNGCTIVVPVTIQSLDTVAPVLQCPGSIAKCDDGFFTTFDLPVAADNCTSGTTITQTGGQASGTYFPIGTTVQSFICSDAAGNTTSCSFSVTIHPLPDFSALLFGDDMDGTGVGYISVTPTGGTMPYSYQWYLNNEPFSMEEDLTGLFAGQYRLVLTDANGCESTLNAVNIDNIVGTEEVLENAGITVMPNPTTAILQIRLSAAQPQSIQLVNARGQLVRNLTQDEWASPVDVQTLPAGMYYLLARFDSGIAIVRWMKM